MNSKFSLKMRCLFLLKHVLCFFFFCYSLILRSVPTSAQIITSTPILTLITKEIVDTTHTVETLISSTETAHDYELTPKTMLHLTKQDLIIFNGLDMEHNLLTLKNKAQFAHKIIEATQDIIPRTNKNGKPDPHAWHDPDKLVQYIDTITNALGKKYPQQKRHFQTRSLALKGKIIQWKKEKLSLVNSLKKPFLMVTPHDGFQYLAQTFGFNNLSLMEDHHGESLSPKELVLKISELKTFPHRSFFGDGTAKDNEFKNLSQKTNSNWGGTLWGEAPPQEGQPQSLIEYLDHNFTTLWLAFQKSPSNPWTSKK